MIEKVMQTKVLPFEVKEVAPRTLEFVGSTEDKDREGDIIMASGWNLKHYRQNPVFLWAHNYQEPPIGKTVKVWASEGKLRFHVLFADRETYEFADTIYKLYKGGFLRASSVGFMPIESEPLELKEDEEIFGHVPTRFLKQELLELSGCPVPANPNALAEAKAKGLLNMTLEEFAEKTAGWAFLDDWQLAQKAIEKPYPNEHACRLRNPDDFQEGTFKRTEREHEGKKYSIIMGRLKGETNMTEQAYRYDKNTWTAGEAKTHCTDHDGTFEAAAPAEDERQAHRCQCVSCGHQMATERHCDELKCPECGADMRGPVPATESQEKPKAKEVSQAEIVDDMDYLRAELEIAGMSETTQQAAWELVRDIMRAAGDDMPEDISAKIGAVLNKTNRERLEKIKTLAQEVLDSAEKEPEPDKELPVDEIAESVIAGLTAAVDKARGKIRR